MLHVEHGEIEMQGNLVDLMADVVAAVNAYRAGVIDSLDGYVKEFTEKMLRDSIEKALSGKYDSEIDIEKEADPAKALEAAEELNRFFDRLEARKKGWRKA